MSILTGRAFAKALEEAGVVSDLNTIERIVIDVTASDLVRVYVQRTGDERLPAVAGLLGAMMAGAAPRAVRYWVAVSRELLDSREALDGFERAGLRLVELGPWRDKHTRLVRLEDPEAPGELDGKEVELTFTRGRVSEDEPYGPDDIRVTGRQVVG